MEVQTYTEHELDDRSQLTALARLLGSLATGSLTSSQAPQTVQLEAGIESSITVSAQWHDGVAERYVVTRQGQLVR